MNKTTNTQLYAMKKDELVKFTSNLIKSYNIATQPSREEDEMVIIKWSWKDVQSLCPELTPTESLDLLDCIAGNLEDRSIEYGWEVMQILIQMEKQIGEQK